MVDLQFQQKRGQEVKTMCHFNAWLVAMGLKEIAPTASCLANCIKLQAVKVLCPIKLPPVADQVETLTASEK